MLVKFMSYIASMIGARRYKPLLISCLVVILSITGISFVATALSSGSPDAASQVGQSSTNPSKGQQPASTNLGGLERKSEKADDSQSLQSNNATGNGDSKQTGNDQTNAQALEITLNTATVNLTDNSPNAAVAVSANNSGNYTWSVAPDQNNGLSGVIASIESMKDKDNQGNASLKFKATAINPGTYTFTITAKDSRGATASKTITVTVN